MAEVVEVEHDESQDCEFISEKNGRGPKKRLCAYGHVTTPIVNTSIQ